MIEGIYENSIPPLAYIWGEKADACLYFAPRNIRAIYDLKKQIGGLGIINTHSVLKCPILFNPWRQVLQWKVSQETYCLKTLNATAKSSKHVGTALPFLASLPCRTQATWSWGQGLLLWEDFQSNPYFLCMHPQRLSSDRY